uniref:Zinc finger protein MAGPIE n=1 Tax=Anthurium amnicola TaxID=1678845 RepID=A0A1D1XKK7_9ARAE
MSSSPSLAMEPPSASRESGSSASTSGHQAAKRKRNPPGMPDPDAEVVALSPETLVATNRFVCEICGKGFRRDQNLRLHRREHNLPWNLRGSSGERPRKRVYVCPVPTCVYHHPARALGDLTGIKKHFFRKHGVEKKYGCDSCSKKYAVLSDWQAHVRMCSGTTRGSGIDGSTPVFRRKRGASGGAIAKYGPSEQSSTVETVAVSNMGTQADEQQRATSPPSQPVLTPVLQLGQLPATSVQQQRQLQQQGQLVLAGYLLFYDCNAQAQGSTEVAK